MWLVKSFIRLLVCWIYDTKVFIREFFQISLFKQHKKIIAEYSGGYFLPNNYNKVAIVNIYPSGESIIFTKNLLVGLVENGFYVLLVSNKKISDIDRSELLPYCHHLIIRLNFGKDFGAHQHGLSWLKDENIFNNIERLILANDSMYYPKNIKNVIAEMLMYPDAWQSLYESFDRFHHAQSFFLMFSKEIINSKVFVNFWKEYFPRAFRRHVILDGEIKISKILVSAGFKIKSYYSGGKIMREIRNRINFNCLDDSLPFIKILSDATKLNPDISNCQLINDTNIYLDNLLKLIDKNIYSNNPTHCVGLLLAYMFSAPIKRDLFFCQTATPTEVVRYAAGFSAEEKLSIENDLKNKGIRPYLTFYSPKMVVKKILFDRGYVL